MNITNTLLTIILLSISILLHPLTGLIPLTWIILLFFIHRIRPPVWFSLTLSLITDLCLSMPIGTTALWAGVSMYILRYITVLTMPNLLAILGMSLGTVFFYNGLRVEQNLLAFSVASLVVWITLLRILRYRAVEEIG